MGYRNFFTLVKSIFLIQVFVICLVVGVSVDLNQTLYNRVSTFNLSGILVPFTSIQISDHQAASLFKEVNVVLGGGLGDEILYRHVLAARLPEDMLVASIQALALGKSSAGVNQEHKTMGKITLPAILQEDDELQKDSRMVYHDFPRDCKVVFYCTHSSESYIPDDGKDRREGKRGLINQVALVLAQEVSARGLNADFVDTIHDYPEYDKSYTCSRKTVKDIINSPGRVVAIFDVHRDSIPGRKEEETVEIGGKKSARILIIVGSDERKEHENWEENLEFANRLYEHGEKNYPGLIKGVRIKAGTYNQEFHNHLLVLEFGTDYNSLNQAAYAAELFSNVLVEVLKEEVD